MILDPRCREAETGASSVEYGLLAAGIAGVIVGAVLALGGTTEEMFDDTCAAMAANEEITVSCD